MLRRHLNFRQISHRFTWSFADPSLQDLNSSQIMYWNMILLNPSRFTVEPNSKYWYFLHSNWDLLSLRFSKTTVLFHNGWLSRKTAGNVNRPPYPYIAAISLRLVPHRLHLYGRWTLGYGVFLTSLQRLANRPCSSSTWVDLCKRESNFVFYLLDYYRMLPCFMKWRKTV